MNTIRSLLRIIGLSPWLFAVSSILSVGLFAVPLLFGVILREFFDLLSGDAPAGIEVRTLAILYFLAILAAFASGMVSSVGEEWFWATWSIGSARTPRISSSPCIRPVLFSAMELRL